MPRQHSFLYRSFVPLLLLVVLAGAAMFLAALPTAEAAPAQQTSPTPALAETRQATATPNASPNLRQEDWETPVNLSRSGGATAPSLVVDQTGVVHAVWKEESIQSFAYAQGTTDWSTPLPVEFPFGTRDYYPELEDDEATPLFTPTLIADGAGRIHALWIDDEENLYHSSVESASFTDYASWSQRVLLADSALKLSAAFDEGQTLHVVYGRPSEGEELPSGLYYVQSPDAGATWTEPALLHQSRYFRTLPADEIAISLAVAGEGEQANLFLAWDNRSLDQVLFIRSPDGGVTWTGETLVDTRAADDPPDAAGPAAVSVIAHSGQVHLLWRAGHEAQSCALYHQWSNDAGETWQPRQRLPTGSQTCPLRSQFLAGTDGLLYVLAILEQQGIMFAWDGEQWSNANVEATLATFLDSETSRRILFQWEDAAVGPENRLMVIGPDSGDFSDVWLISRSLGSASEWFPPPTAWSAPLVIASVDTEPTTPLLVPGANGVVHALWVQGDSLGGNGSTIYYSRRDDESWLRPSPILSSSSTTFANPSAAVNQLGRIFAIWQSSDGMLQFSQANADQAHIAREWSSPQTLPADTAAIRSPQIVAAPDGSLYAAYAVALNEERGIYFISSQDGGTTWSDPVQVFDGIAAGWDMIDRPRLALSANGVLHLLWSRYTLPPDATPLSLLYARSVDEGQTWSDATIVDEGPIYWSELAVAGERQVHRLWAKSANSTIGFWYDSSLDMGQNWERMQQIQGLSATTTANSAAVAVDAGGRPHFTLLTEDELQYLWWNGESWISGDSLTLRDETRELLADSLVSAATIDTNAHLTVVYSGEVKNTNAEDEPVEYVLLTTAQQLQTVEGDSTPLPTLPPSPTPEAPATATLIPTPSPTAVIPLPLDSPAGGGSQIPFLSSDSIVLSLALGVVPVLLLVVLTVAIGLRRSQRRHR